MKFIDMFCGMGTARMGFEQAGHECVYSIEWDKHKRQIYKVVFGNEPEGKDIRDTRASELPKSDCWIAGFPCQDISVAGSQKGFEGNRSSLYFEVMRLLHESKQEDKPSYLLFENVKNFFSVNGGRDFLSALTAMDEVGYDAEWSLLNSKHFGVPQNRERVFIVGHLRGRSTRKVFPFTGTDKKTGAGIKILFHRNGYRRNSQVYDKKGIIECLDTCQGGGRQPHVSVQIKNGHVKIKEDDICSCLDANYCKGLDNHAARTGIAIKKIAQINNSQSGAIYDPNGLSVTLTGHGGGQGAKTGLYQVDSRIRRLTPRECMRLQGVQDKTTDKLIEAKISDTQMYRAAGDAWTVNVGYEIAKRMGVSIYEL